MRGGSGGLNLAVRWPKPNGDFEEPMSAFSLAGTRLIPFDGVETVPGIYQQTPNITVTEGQNAVMSVLATNGAPVGYQWRLNGVNLPGVAATKPVFTVTNV